MGLPIAAKNKKEIRQNVGYNLGAIIVSTVTDTKDTTSLWDSVQLARYGDDDLIGSQVQINTPTGSIVSGEQSIVTDFADCNEDCTMYPAFTANITSGDIYELWKADKDFNIQQVDSHINQAIVAATDDIAVDKIDTTLVKKENQYEYTVPSGFIGLHTVEFVNKIGIDVLVDAAEVVWTSGAGTTTTLDATIERVGTYCSKNVVVSVGTNTILCYEDISSVDLSDCDKIEFWMYSSIALTAGQLQIKLDDTAAIASALESIDIPAMDAATWYRHSLSLANPQSDTAIISVGFYQVANVDDFTFYHDDIHAVKDGSKVYAVMPPNEWGIVNASTKLLQFSEVGYNWMKLGYTMRLSGYQIPAELSDDTTDCTIDPDYVVAKATSTLFAANAGGRDVDVDNNMKKFELWRDIAERRLLQSRTPLEMNTRWCG